MSILCCQKAFKIIQNLQQICWTMLKKMRIWCREAPLKQGSLRRPCMYVITDYVINIWTTLTCIVIGFVCSTLLRSILSLDQEVFCNAGTSRTLTKPQIRNVVQCQHLVKTTVIVCMYVTKQRLHWCDCEMIDDLPSVNDGEDEDEEIEGLHHGNSLLLVWTWTVIFHLVRVDIVLIPSLAALFWSEHFISQALRFHKQ